MFTLFISKWKQGELVGCGKNNRGHMFKNSLCLIWGPAGPGGGWDSQVSVKWNALMKKTRLLLCSSCVLYCISPIAFSVYLRWHLGLTFPVVFRLICHSHLLTSCCLLRHISDSTYVISAHWWRFEAAVTFQGCDIVCPLHSLMQSLWRTLAQPFRSTRVPYSPHLTYSTEHSAAFYFRKVCPSSTLQKKKM